MRSTIVRPGIVFLLVLLAGAPSQPAQAQRPFRLYDFFSRGESGRRSFYDGYAFTTEVSYRESGSLQGSEQTYRPGLGLGFRFDYALADHLDFSAIVDAPTGNAGRTLSLDWLVLKYYETIEANDYALRVAVDPSVDGRMGFPQADVSFITSSLLSPSVSSDYSLGIRHVRVGYEQLVPSTGNDNPEIPLPARENDIVFTRAVGWEVHFTMQYSLLLNPARSNVFTSLVVDRGQYSVFETSMRRSGAQTPEQAMKVRNTPGVPGPASEEKAREFTDEYQGGAIWVRSGMEYNRPAYQVLPFVNIPLKQWVPNDDENGRARISFGVRFMIR